MIRTLAILAAGLAGAWAVPASASLVCTTVIVGQSGTCSESGITTATQSLTEINGSVLDFDLFNTTFAGAGTSSVLTSVTFTISAVTSLSGTLSNPSAGSLTGHATGEADYTFSSAGNADFSANLAADDEIDLNTKSATVTLGSGQLNVPITGATLTKSGSAGLTGPDADFEASSAQQLDLDIAVIGSLGQSTNGSGSQLITNTQNTGDVTISVTYGYTVNPITEPFSAAALATGMLGLALTRRRRSL